MVDDPIRAENRSAASRLDADRRSFPEGGAALVDDAGRVDHSPDREVVAQRAGDSERNEPALRHAVRYAQAHQGSRAEAAGDPLLDRHRAGEDQPVSDHAMLLALSLRDDAASYAAEGSKPEWMAQCSHRGSLPGPYSSHSMPSSSAS